MKRIIFIVLGLVLMASTAWAAPFLVCDPQTGVTSYKITGGGAWITSPVAAQADGSLRVDVSGAPVGTSSLTVSACKTDAVWGELCSSTIPFSFTRPSPPTTPTNLKLGL